MTLFYFLSAPNTLGEAQLILQLAMRFSKVLFLAQNQTIADQWSSLIPEVKYNPDLFTLECKNNAFVKFVIYIDESPASMLQFCLNRNDLVPAIQPNQIITTTSPFTPVGDLNFVMTGSTHKILLAASKILVYDEYDDVITDAKLKMMFLAHKFNMKMITL